MNALILTRSNTTNDKRLKLTRHSHTETIMMPWVLVKDVYVIYHNTETIVFTICRSLLW